MKKNEEKRKYTPPEFEKEKVFEVNAPSCGKCIGSGSTGGGFSCIRLIKNS
jgi:hypothetical protein